MNKLSKLGTYEQVKEREFERISEFRPLPKISLESVKTEEVEDVERFSIDMSDTSEVDLEDFKGILRGVTAFAEQVEDEVAEEFIGSIPTVPNGFSSLLNSINNISTSDLGEEEEEDDDFYSYDDEDDEEDDLEEEDYSEEDDDFYSYDEDEEEEDEEDDSDFKEEDYEDDDSNSEEEDDELYDYDEDEEEDEEEDFSDEDFSDEDEDLYNYDEDEEDDDLESEGYDDSSDYEEEDGEDLYDYDEDDDEAEEGYEEEEEEIYSDDEDDEDDFYEYDDDEEDDEDEVNSSNNFGFTYEDFTISELLNNYFVSSYIPKRPEVIKATRKVKLATKSKVKANTLSKPKSVKTVEKPVYYDYRQSNNLDSDERLPHEDIVAYARRKVRVSESVALRYFSPKEIEVALKREKIMRKNGLLIFTHS